EVRRCGSRRHYLTPQSFELSGQTLKPPRHHGPKVDFVLGLNAAQARLPVCWLSATTPVPLFAQKPRVRDVAGAGVSLELSADRPNQRLQVGRTEELHLALQAVADRRRQIHPTEPAPKMLDALRRRLVAIRPVAQRFNQPEQTL